MSGTPDIPGEGWYLAAGGAVLGGLVVAIALIAWLFLGRDEGTQFTAPGRVAVELRPGAHLIWNDYRTTFEGTRYESPAEARPVPAIAAPQETALRRLTAIVYGLQLAGYFTGLSPVAGVILNYAKRDAVAGTWLESHFRWQIRTFWITLAWSVAGLVLLLAFVGIFVLGVAAMWFLYRAIKGWIALSEGKPMYGP